MKSGRIADENESFPARRRHEPSGFHSSSVPQDFIHTIMQRSDIVTLTLLKACRSASRLHNRSHHYEHCGIAGISLKTVELYALVFLMRYLDLFTNFTSLCAFAVSWLHGTVDHSHCKCIDP